MRRCLAGDLFEAAAVIAASHVPDRSRFARSLVEQADAAHRYMKRFGQPHPAWGNGSLMARALAEPALAPRPALQSAAFLSALALISMVLAARKRPAPH